MATMLMIVIIVVCLTRFTSEAPFNPSSTTLTYMGSQDPSIFPFPPSPPTSSTSTGAQGPSIGQEDPSGMVYEGSIGYEGAPVAHDILNPSDTINTSNTLLQTVNKMIDGHGFFQTMTVIIILFVVAPALACILLGKCVKGGCGTPEIEV